MPDQIKAILFDADGVVISTSKKFSEYASQELNLSKTEIDTFFATDFQDCLVGKADLNTRLKPHLLTWGWHKSADDLIKKWFEIEDIPNSELIKLIPELMHRGIFCYLTTNQEENRAKYLFEDMKFGKLFNHFFSSHEIKAKKPDQKYWQYVWSSIQYLEDFDDKKKILVIDDTERNIASALEFGFQAHHFQNNAECITLLNSL